MLEHAGPQPRDLPIFGEDLRFAGGSDFSGDHPNRIAADVDRGIAWHKFIIADDRQLCHQISKLTIVKE